MGDSSANENQDQSMEEILQSIKRIIADEDGDNDDDEMQAEPSSQNEEGKTSAGGSDVLELTEMVQEDGTVTNVQDDERDFKADSAPLPPSEPKKKESAMASRNDDESLVSDDTARASAAALNSLKSAETPAPKPRKPIESPEFRSGNTVEDLVMESLRPMLKDWLDTNLPQIVEELVEKEVRRIASR